MSKSSNPESKDGDMPVRGALLLSFITQQSRLLIGFISTILIARILTPAEIGVFAVASAAVIIAIEIRTFGVSQYIVREPDITEAKLRSALGVMMGVSWTLALTLFLSAPVIAAFYNYEELKYLFRILSITFLLAPFSTVPFSLMQRSMRFDLIFRIRVGSALIRLIGSVGLVLLGMSFYGLAIAVVLGAVFELVAIQILSSSRAPVKPSLSEWRAVLGFGAPTGAAGVLRQLTASTPDLVLGRTLSMADVGLFSRGLGLVTFLHGIVTAAVASVILPHLSRTLRAGGKLGEEYLNCIVLHGVIAVPVFAVAAVLSEPLILLFFGPQWGAAAPVSALVCVGAAISTIHGFLPKALMAAGKVNVLLSIGLIAFLIRLCLVILAAPYGLVAVAKAFVISGVMDLAVSSFIAHTQLQLKWKRQLRAFIPIWLIAFLCAFSVDLICQKVALHADSALIQLAVSGLAALMIWISALCISRHPLWFEITSLLSSRLGRVRLAK